MSQKIINKVLAFSSKVPVATVHAELEKLDIKDVVSLAQQHQTKKITQIINAYIKKVTHRKRVVDASRKVVIENYKTGQSIEHIVKTKQFPDATVQTAYEIKSNEPELTKHRPSTLTKKKYQPGMMSGIKKSFSTSSWK